MACGKTFRAFSNEVRHGEAHHFLCKVDRSKIRQEAFREYQEGQRELSSLGMSLIFLSHPSRSIHTLLSYCHLQTPALSLLLSIWYFTTFIELLCLL